VDAFAGVTVDNNLFVFTSLELQLPNRDAIDVVAEDK
jgi:hypothetical protein